MTPKTKPEPHKSMPNSRKSDSQKTNSRKRFSKYDFVKSYIAASNTTSPKLLKEKEAEAVIIADAIRNDGDYLIENLASKKDLYEVRDEMHIEFSRINAKLETLHSETQKDIKTLRSETQKDIKTLRSETQKDIRISMLTTIISLGAIMTLIEKFIN
ncbi:MAG: hypothetical protein O3B09_03750 [Proteobacteria bacterium]|nr:hypothetical protein [Pseudomonadota bacterium]